MKAVVFKDHDNMKFGDIIYDAVEYQNRNQVWMVKGRTEQGEYIETYADLVLRKPDSVINSVDWEQRRYEIAKDLYIHYPNLTEKEAIENADKLIAELKKGGDNEN